MGEREALVKFVQMRHWHTKHRNCDEWPMSDYLRAFVISWPTTPYQKHKCTLKIVNSEQREEKAHRRNLSDWSTMYCVCVRVYYLPLHGSLSNPSAWPALHAWIHRDSGWPQMHVLILPVATNWNLFVSVDVSMHYFRHHHRHLQQETTTTTKRFQN